jgi:murein DD-endopeptidase MepM/ murein hydrolase activator NlpD
LNKKIFLIPDDQGTCWYGFFGVDLGARPGISKIAVDSSPLRRRETVVIEIERKDYGLRRLTLPKDMVELDAETLERVKEESRVMKALWVAPSTEPLWRGAFLRPIPGSVVGSFGRKSVINNKPKSPHSGVDLRGERGTPVKAVNNGRVALTAEHFFSGKSVVIDHGGGILSMYFHLGEILVERDQIVEKGHTIGLVGSSGRSTGPHLHWGVRMNGARVDPIELLAVSKELEE